MRLKEFVEDQALSPRLIAGELRTTKSEIADTLGLSKDAFMHASLVRARKTQARLRQMLEILNRVEAATGSPLAAGLRRRHPRSVGAGGQGRPGACVSGPRHGGRLRLILRSPDAIPGAGVPCAQSTVVLDADVRRGRPSPRRAIQPTWGPSALRRSPRSPPFAKRSHLAGRCSR